MAAKPSGCIQHYYGHTSARFKEEGRESRSSSHVHCCRHYRCRHFAVFDSAAQTNRQHRSVTGLTCLAAMTAGFASGIRKDPSVVSLTGFCIIRPAMASRLNHSVIWTYPSRKKLFLLVVLVVGLLTAVSILLMLRANSLEGAPQAPLFRPIVHLVTPQNSVDS